MYLKSHKWLILIAVICIFVALTFIMTFPLFVRVNTSISGFYSSDEPSVWYFWWIKFANENALDHRDCRYLAYPYGQDYGIYDTLYPLWSLMKRVIALTTNPCFSYNIEIILSYILAGFFTYLLAKFILHDTFVSLFCGIIYAFCPYHFARAWQHIGLAHIQWMPLYIYALIRFQKNRNWLNMLFLSAALFLVASFDYYYLYFMLLVTLIFMLYFFIYDARKNLRTVVYIALNAILILSVVTLIIWPFIKMRVLSADSNAVSVWGVFRPFEDLFVQSARPLSYFLPSTEHPVFGWITKNFIGTTIYGRSLTEHALYLGWVPVALAYVAFRRLRLRYGRQPDEKFYIGFFSVMAAAAWLFSQPPWWNIAGLKLYMPSFFLYKILSMFRAYCRFGVLVMLAVSILAGFGLKFLLGKFKTLKAKIVVIAFFCGLVLFEFWNYPPFKIIDLSKAPQPYYWLKAKKGDFVIAEYPLDTRGPREIYKFYQTIHEKRIINGTLPGTYANKAAQDIIKLSNPATVTALRKMGVSYIIVHRQDYLKTGLLEDEAELNKISQNYALKFIMRFPRQDCPQKGIICGQRTGEIDIYEPVVLR